ncbi:MAG: hypothetical protein OEV30_08040 [Ignavibacteria bacterium]|nr:hypothetical protein [Ignavibacteria bacterium]
MTSLLIVFGSITLVILPSLTGCEEDSAGQPGVGVSPDEALFLRVTRTDPFTAYSLFPNADSVTSGTLNGSNAHQPLVKVSMNAAAAGALQNGILPPGTAFPNGSIIFKEIIVSGETTLFAIMEKDSGNALAGNNWIWAELYPDGRVFYSVESRGGICVPCHLREQGPANDLVRTFERQN